jgi:hypothetical protein
MVYFQSVNGYDPREIVAGSKQRCHRGVLTVLHHYNFFIVEVILFLRTLHRVDTMSENT